MECISQGDRYGKGAVLADDLHSLVGRQELDELLQPFGPHGVRQLLPVRNAGSKHFLQGSGLGQITQHLARINVKGVLLSLAKSPASGRRNAACISLKPQ